MEGFIPPKTAKSRCVKNAFAVPPIDGILRNGRIEAAENHERHS